MRLTPLLFAMAAVPAAAQPAPDYRAGGTEPFWSLTITRGSMRLEQVGLPTLAEPAPVARPSFNGRRYVGRRMTVDVTRAPCSDGMSDRRYPETVIVQAGRRTLRGCGGLPAAGEARLDGTRWRIVAIDGRAVRLDRPATIVFADGRMSGRPGCNSMSGSYRLTGDRLTFSPLISTRMACPGEPMRVENAFARVAAAPISMVRGRGTMEWRNRAGRVTFSRIDAR